MQRSGRTRARIAGSEPNDARSVGPAIGGNSNTGVVGRRTRDILRQHGWIDSAIYDVESFERAPRFELVNDRPRLVVPQGHVEESPLVDLHSLNRVGVVRP